MLPNEREWIGTGLADNFYGWPFVGLMGKILTIILMTITTTKTFVRIVTT
jgi:hypothetical protein